MGGILIDLNHIIMHLHTRARAYIRVHMRRGAAIATYMQC